MTKRIILIAILLIATFFRIYLALTCHATPDYSDMAMYNEAALSSGITAFPPPGYPLFLRAIYAIFGVYNYIAVFVIQGILSALTVFFIYYVTRKVSNENAGLIAAGIAAIYPNLIAYNLTTLTETLSVTLVMIILLIAVTSLKDTHKSILTGIIITIGYFIKPTMLFFIPGLLIGLKKRLVLILTIVITLSPFILHSIVTGTGEGRMARLLYKSYNPKAAISPRFKVEDTELGGGDVSSKEYLSKAVEFILSHKWKTLDIIHQKASILISRGWDEFVFKDIVGKNQRLLLLMIYGYIPIMIFGFVGLIRCFNKDNRIIALMMISYLIIHILITIFKVRYRLLVEPMLIMYAGILIGSSSESRTMKRFDAEKIKNFFTRIFRRTKPSTQPPASECKESIIDWFRRDRNYLLIIICLALALRIYFALAVEQSPLPNEDLKLNNLALSGGLNADKAPLYPLFLRSVYKLFGSSNFKAVYMIQGVMNTITVVLMYILGSKLCSSREGLIAASITAIYPQFLSHGVSINPTSFGIFVVVLLMLITISRYTERFKAIALGVLVGIGILIKPLYAFLLPGTFIIAKNKLVFLITMLVLLTPLAVRNSVVENHFIPVYKPYAYGVDMMKYRQRYGESRTIEALYANAQYILRKDFQDKLKSDLKDEVRNVNYTYTYSYIIIMLLGLAGLFKYGRRKHLPVILPVLGYMILLVFFSNLFNKPQARFLWEPVLITYGAILLNRRCTAS